jgi:single-stranded-DNA-specific exonuclease
VGGGEGDHWRGSGRSIAGFDLAAGLRECDDLLVRHGGHAMAAGLTISAANLGSFRERLNDIARRNLPREDLEPALYLDAETKLSEITFGSVRVLERIRPTGQGNAPVRFCARNLVHQRPLQRVGKEKQHVKMWVTDGTATHEAIWWRAGNESLPVGKFDLAFALETNNYQGTHSVQLKTLDWRTADGNGTVVNMGGPE